MNQSPRSFDFSPSAPFWLACAAVISLIAPKPSAEAATLYWDANGTATTAVAPTGTWGTSAFWSTSSAGSAATANTTITSADDVFFSAASNGLAGTVTISGAQVASSITFDDPVAITLSGGTSITIGGTGTKKGVFVASTATTAANTISTALILANSASTIQNAGTGVLTISGGITGAQNLTLQNNGATANGVTISTGSLNNTGTVTNSGSAAGSTLISAVIGTNVTGVTQNSATSPLTLSGANTYTSKTTVSAGTLSFNTIGNVGAVSSALGAPTTVANGTIDLGGNLTYTGGATSSDRVINLTNAAATNTITNSGSALLTLTGGFTGNSTSLLFRGTQPITVSGVIPASFTGVVSRTDVAVLTLSNSSNAFSGNLVISSGTISANSIANSGLVSAIGAGSQITLGQSGFNNTGTFQFTGASGGSSNRAIDIQSNTGNTNGGIIENTVAGQTLTLSGNVTTGGLGTTPSLQLIGAGNGVMSGIIGGTGLSLTKGGTGTWALSNTANTYNGTTSITGGILNVAALSNYGVAGSLGNRAAASDISTSMGINIQGGTLQYTGSTATSTDRQLRIKNGTTGATIDASGSVPAATMSFTYALANTNFFDTAGTRTLTLTGTNTGDNLFALNIQDQATSGAGTSLVKSGTGTWVITNSHNADALNGTNNTFGGYSGGTTINAGSLVARNAGALGAPGRALTIAGGGTLDLQSDATINALNTTINGTGTATIISNKLTNPSAGITHTLGTLSIGAQTLAITQGANATGTTAGITFGNVTQTGASVFDVATGTTLTLGALQTTAQNITKQNSGTLVLATAANAARVAGSNVLTAGTLRLGSVSALGTTGATLTLNGGTLDLATDTTVNAYNTTVGGGTTIVSNRATSGAGITHTLGTLSIGAQTLTVNTGANSTGTTAGVAFGAATLTGAATFAPAASTSLTFNSTTALGANLLTKSGAGSLTLNGVVSGTKTVNTTAMSITGGTVAVGVNTNTFNGNIAVDGATSVFQVATGATYTTTSPFGTVSGGTSMKQLLLTNGGTFRLNSGTLNNNSVTTTNIGGGIIFNFGTGGGVLDVASDATLIIDDGSATTTAANAAQLQGSGTLTKTGLGILQQDDSTAFAGAMIIAAGTFQPASANAGGAPSAGTTIQSGAQYNVNGVTMTNAEPLSIIGTGLASAPKGALTNNTGAGTWVGPITLTGNATIGNSAGGLTLSSGATINAGGFVLTMDNTGTGNFSANSVISNGSVIVSGTGQYVPNAQSTYAGGTSFSAGSSTIPQQNSTGNPGSVTSGPLGTGTLSFVPTAQIRARQSTVTTLNNDMTLNGGVNFLTASLEANIIFGGPVTLSGGNATITSTVGTTVAGTSAILNGAIGDGGNNFGLIKAGAGNLTLGGANTYTGGTTVNAGVLNLPGSLAANTGLTVAAGALFSLGSGTANPLTSVSNLNLGAGTGTANLAFDLGADTAGSDRLITSAAATTINTVGLTLIPLTTIGSSTTYDLISAASGLSGATYVLNSGAGGYAYSLSAPSDTLVQVTVTPVTGTGSLYWGGSINNSWSGLGASGATTNWTTDANGTTIAGYNPTVGNTVIFSAANALGSVFSTTLDNNYTVNDLQFTASPAGVTAVNIAAGPLNPGSLTLTPTSSSTGIDVASNAGTVTISAPVVLGAAQTWSADGTGANGSSLTMSGIVTGAVANSLAINGLVTLAGSGTSYSGPTTVPNLAILQSGAANSFSANSAVTMSGTGILRLNGFNNTILSLAGSGTVQNNSAATAATLTAGDSNNLNFSGILQNGGTAALGLTKTGTGSLTLSNASTHTGNTLVTNGTLNVSGTGSLTGNTTSTRLQLQPTVAGNSSIVNYTSSAASTFFSINGANVTGTASVLNQTDGVIQISPNGTTDTQSVVQANGSYGAYNISGGTFRSSTGTTGGSRFTITNQGTASATNGTITGVRVGIVNVSGTGFIDHRDAEWWLNYSLGQINVTDSGKIDHTGSSQPFGLVLNTNVVGAGYGVLNLAGTGAQVITGAQPLRFGNSTVAGQGDGYSAFVNLAAGTLSTGTIGTTSLPAAPTATNYWYYNYAGGTLKATGTLATGWSPATGASATVINTIFGAIDNSAVSGAPSFTGGLTVDTNNNPVTIPSTQPLLGAGGVGVTQANLSVSGGSGYIGTPSVTFSKPAAPNGVAAAGYAIITGGAVTGIVITDPGVYAANETPTISLLGGFAAGAGTAAAVTSSALTTNNTSGGLTKIGLGTLTLSGAGNTYSAGTTVSAGTLALGVNGGLPTGGNLTIKSTGTFDAATFTNTVGTVSLQDSGILTGSSGVLTSNADYDLRSGTVNFTGAGGLAGAGNVIKSTAGTVTLTNNGLGSFAKAVNVTGGTLAFSTANQLGNASATNILGLNGGTLSYTAATTSSLVANQVLTLGSGGGTLNASDASGVLNLLGGVTTSSAANLTKNGLGTIAITGSTNLTGGNVTVSAGVLNAGFTPTGLGSISVSSGATLNLYDGATTTMAISGLTLSSGSSLGFDLNAPGVNDILNLTGTASITPTISLNFNSLGGLAAGTYDLLNVTGGSLSGGDYTLGSAPSGFNYVFSTINSDQTLRLTTTPLNLVYWHGDIAGGSWSALNAGPDTNFSNVLSGATDLGSLPVATDTLVFSTTTATGSTIATTLDGNFTVDSLRFTSNPTGVTSVNIDQGTGGTLTIAPVGSNNGISVAATAGTISIGAPVIAGLPQTWETANSTALNVSGVVTYTSGVTKTGNGVLTLSGNNTGTGGLNLAGGTLNLAHNSALGTGAFTIGAGTTINASVGAIVNAGNNPQNWNGSFTFTGTNALDLGTGAVALNNSATITTAASTLTVGGAIGDGGNNRSLTKAGAGTLTLSGVNTYSGGTTLNAGTLNLGNVAALGSGTFTLAGGTIDNTTGVAGTLSGNQATVINGSFTFTGTNSLNLGTGAVTLGTSPTITTNGATSTLNIGGNIALTTNGLTKDGPGTLILVGTNNYTGNTTVNAGTLRMGGSSAGTAITVNNAGSVLQIGSATGLTAANTVSLTASTTLDLFGNSATIGALTSVSTSTITNTSAVPTVSTATAPGTPALTDALTVSPLLSAAVAALITDGSTRKTQIIVSNNNGGVATGNTANTYSGGLVLANSGNGTRIQVGTITGTPFGSGPIIIGQAATDKAGIYFNTASQTLTNDVVFNTALGTDRFGIRSDIAGTTLSGQITANSDAVFSSNTTTGALVLTNKVSGAGGLVLDLSQTSTASTVLTVTLNSAANANDYQGDTVVGRTNVAPTKDYTATLTLGAANQIPNGAGKGNVILNNNTASRTGNLNLAGFSETINGLGGNGTLDGTSGTPTLTLGDNNATATFSGILKNTAGNLALTKIGTGTQTLSGANTFSGVTTNSAGTLSLGNNLALQNSPLDTLNSIAGDATNGLKTTVTSLTLGGLTGNKDFASVFTTTAGGYNTVTALTLNPGTGLSPAYTGSITDGATGMSINKSGAGTQILNGALSHTGGISVTVGTLTLGSSSNSYAGNTAISSGAGLIVTADGALGATGTGNGTTVAGALGLSGGITYSTVEKIVGSGVGNAAAPAGFPLANRGFIQSVSGNNTFAGDVELSANGTSRIGTQTGAQLTLSGAITQGTGVTTADVLFRAGDNAGDFVTLSNTGNSFGGNSTVFTGATVGNYAGVRLGVTNGLPTNLTISGLSSTGAGAALDLNGKNQTLNGLITGGGAMSIVNIDTVNDSTLTLNPTADKSSSNTLVLGGSGLGVINVVKDGSFTQTLSGANTYTGTTSISAGSLSINNIANVGAASSAIGAPTTVATGLIAMGRAAATGTLIYTGAVQSTDRTIQIGTNSTTPALTDTGGATIEANGASNAALTFSAPNFNTQTIAATGVGADRILTLQGASIGANTISGIIQNNLVSGVATGTASVSLNKAGAGTWILAGDNTYSGGTTLTAGILQATHNNAFGTGAVTVNGTRLIVNAGVTVPNDINIGSNTGASGRGLIEPAGTGVGTFSGAINITNATPAGGLFAGTPTADLHLSGVITSSVVLTQRDRTVIYSGGGTGYNGLTVTGTARVGATNGIATSATVNLGGSAAANLDLNGFNQSLVGITKVPANAAIIGNSSTTSNSVLTTTGTSEYAGIIQNVLGSGTRTVGLTVASGALTLTGANTFTGGTTVAAGTLSLTGTGSLADTGAVTLTSNTSVFNISGISASEKIATLAGVANSTVALGAKTLELGDGTAEFSGDIEGTGGSVTKSGTGVQTLSGNNTFTGSTNISGGTLLLGSNTALPSGAGLSLSGGTLQTGAFGATTGALSVTAESIIDMNDAASVLTFANTGSWSGLLKIWNYSGGAVWTGSTGDKLLFDAGSAPASNLVQFYSDGGITPVGAGGGFIPSGLGSELVPVPEASTVFGALALLGLVGYRERRRR